MLSLESAKGFAGLGLEYCEDLWRSLDVEGDKRGSCFDNWRR